MVSYIGTPGMIHKSAPVFPHRGSFFYITCRKNLTKFNISVINPNPEKKPVNNLFILLDSYFVRYCIVPSIAIGNIKRRQMIDFIFMSNIAITIAAIYPIIIPVHLAQTGS